MLTIGTVIDQKKVITTHPKTLFVLHILWGFSAPKEKCNFNSLIRKYIFERAGVRVLSYSNWLITFLPTNEKPSSFSLSTNDKPPYIQ